MGLGMVRPVDDGAEFIEGIFPLPTGQISIGQGQAHLRVLRHLSHQGTKSRQSLLRLPLLQEETGQQKAGRDVPRIATENLLHMLPSAAEIPLPGVNLGCLHPQGDLPWSHLEGLLQPLQGLLHLPLGQRLLGAADGLLGRGRRGASPLSPEKGQGQPKEPREFQPLLP